MRQYTQSKLYLKEIVFFGLYSALLIALKESMNVLPNIEPVTVLLIALTSVFGWKAILPTYVFSVIEILLHGFHIWNFMYLYVWAILVIICLSLKGVQLLIERSVKNYAALCITVMWTVVAALYGLLFGTLCSIPYFITMGPAGAFSWIVSGISFDIVHGFSNGIITAWAYYPLYKVLRFARKRINS